MSPTHPGDQVHRILVPTDFSANAATALNWACQVAQTHGASITLLHVADVVSMTSLPLAIQEQIAEALRKLEGTARESGVPITTMQRAGRPWETVSAEAAAFDLVVVGARGHTPGTVHMLGVGSTADRVLRTSPAPVLTVRRDGPIAGGRLRRIIVPTDFSEIALVALDSAVRLIRPTAKEPLHVTLLHAWQPLVDYEGAFAGGEIVNPIDGTEQEVRDILESLAARTRTEAVEVTPVVRSGYPATVIGEEARTAGAQMIAIATHGRSGVTRWMLGSVAERVVHHVTCPVLTVRQPLRAATPETPTRPLQTAT